MMVRMVKDGPGVVQARAGESVNLPRSLAVWLIREGYAQEFAVRLKGEDAARTKRGPKCR